MIRAEFAEFKGLDDRITVDTSENRTYYLLQGKNGSSTRLSASAYALLKIFLSGMPYDEAARQLELHQKRKVTAEKLEEACQMVAKQVLDIERNTDHSKPFGFWFLFRLLPRELVGRVSSWLTPAFRLRLAVPLLLMITVACVAMSSQSPSSVLDSTAFWPGYCLLLLSLVCHEFGHATACARYGAPPHDIGFTVYLIYPAFYADVSAAWQLNRWQRVLVDVGGAYFQLVAGAAFAAGYLAFGWEAGGVAFWMIFYSLVFSLNPIFRFDGYWVLADALGVTNLGRQPFVMLGRLFDRLRGKAVEPLPWPWLVVAVLLIYTPATLLFWGYFLVRLLPALGQRLLDYPVQLAALFETLWAGDFAIETLHQLLVSTFLLVVSSFMIWRLFGPLVVLLVKKTRAVLMPPSDGPASSAEADAAGAVGRAA